MKKFFAGVVYCILYVMGLLPLRVHYFFSSVFAFILRRIVRYRYSVIVANIARSFPEMKYGEIKSLTAKYYSHMCDIFAENIWNLAHSASALRKHISVSGTEVIDELQKKYGNVLLVMGHCGNWELVSAAILPPEKRTEDSFSSHPVYMVYKAARNKFSDLLFRKLRMREYKKFQFAGEVLESKQVLRHALKNKDGKAIYVLISDQNSIGPHDPVVDFLGQKTYMLPGPEFLASKLKMPVAYLRMNLLSRGKYHIEFEKITEEAHNMEDYFVTKEFARLLEEDIRSNQVNWLWSHRRWKRNISLSNSNIDK